jgi:adhesin/invasin
LVTDQNGNPIPGVNVTFTVSDPSQAALTCTTTQDLLAAGYVFNPIYTGAYPGAAGVPSSGVGPNPGAGTQAGQTSLGSPFPLTSATTSTIQGTPLGSTCYSGTALGGTTGLGTVPPGSITSLTDNTGVAYVTLVGLPSGGAGAGVVVTATVYSGGIPPTAISARSTPFIIQGAPIGNIHGVFTVNPNFISSPTNTAEVRVCFSDPNGLPAPQGLPVVFTIVDRSSGLLDTAFTQFSTGSDNHYATASTDANGCATINVLATGSGTVTVSATLGSTVVTTTISVGSEGVPSGQPGIFTASPSSTTAICPDANQWLGAYWQGPNTPALTAMQACPNADRLWVRRGTTWLGAAPDQSGASDQFDIVPREFAFLHGRP